MKKVITILIVICVILSASTVSAEPDQEILFRGISWDLPAEEYEKALYDTWFGHDYFKSFLKEEDEANFPFFDGHVEKLQVMSVRNYHKILNILGSMYVGGYEVYSITGTALPLVKNGVVGKQLSDYRFVNWEYLFYTDDADSAFDDLSAKLSSLYGDSTAIENKADDVEMASIWNGSNSTCAVLIKATINKDSGIVKNIRLVYTFSNLADWVAAINDPSSTVDRSSTDGL